MKTKVPRRGVEARPPRDYRQRCVYAEREPSTSPGHCAPPRRGIFQVPRGGAGAATYVTLGGRSLRRGYAQARGTSGVRQEGLSPRNHLKDIESSKDWPPHLGVTKGKGYGL
jgi:hypothetical protein